MRRKRKRKRGREEGQDEDSEAELREEEEDKEEKENPNKITWEDERKEAAPRVYEVMPVGGRTMRLVHASPPVEPSDMAAPSASAPPSAESTSHIDGALGTQAGVMPMEANGEGEGRHSDSDDGDEEKEEEDENDGSWQNQTGRHSQQDTDATTIPSPTRTQHSHSHMHVHGDCSQATECAFGRAMPCHRSTSSEIPHDLLRVILFLPSISCWMQLLCRAQDGPSAH